MIMRCTRRQFGLMVDDLAACTGGQVICRPINKREYFLLVTGKQALACINQRKQQRRGHIISINLVAGQEKLLKALSVLTIVPVLQSRGFKHSIEGGEHFPTNAMGFAAGTMCDPELAYIAGRQDKAGQRMARVNKEMEFISR